MKKALKLTLAIAMLLSTASLYAQKFGRVNVQEVVLAMPETKEAQTNMEAFQKDLAATYEAMQVDYNQKVADLQKNEATLTDSMKQLKYRDIQDLTNRMRQFEEDAGNEMQRKQNELMEPIFTKVQDAIAKVSKEGGFMAVFNTSLSTLAFFDEATLIDVAPQVQTELGIVAQ